jgi:CubicO group peptidase (beta-lactamase class C family)
MPKLTHRSTIQPRLTRRGFMALLSAGAVGACTASRPSGAQRSHALAGEIDAAIERALGLDLAAGFGVAVYSREGRYVRGLGIAATDTRERVCVDTAFYVASSTKSMTALAFALLHARGSLSLDATLAEFSPQSGLPAATRPGEVRLRDLLAHIGGIANEPIELHLAFTGQHDANALWSLLAASEPNADAPLGRFQYANVGYNIATILSDRRLGIRWQELLRREIFEPASLTRTSASMSHAQVSRWSIAKPHRLGPSGVRAFVRTCRTCPSTRSASPSSPMTARSDCASSTRSRTTSTTVLAGMRMPRSGSKRRCKRQQLRIVPLPGVSWRVGPVARISS